MTAALATVGEQAVAGAAASEAASGDSVVGAAQRAQARKKPIVTRTGTDLTGARAPKANFSGQRGGRQGTGAPARGGAPAAGKPSPDRAGSKNFKLKLGGAGGTGAHKLVVAEFILVIILIGISPIMTRKPSGGHLYLANDFVRLTAACLLFFVLGLASNNPRSSRFAAAFGGLVTLGVMFNSLGAITAMANLFIPPAKRVKSAGSPGSGLGGPVNQQ